MKRLSVSLVTGEDIVFDIPEGGDGMSELLRIGDAIANCSRVIRIGQEATVVAIGHVVAARIVDAAAPSDGEDK